MKHDHVGIAVEGVDVGGFEAVPARRLSDSTWELLNSPLYAMDAAAGDVVKIVDEESGSFEILKRGGNVCVQVYLGELDADDSEATTRLAENLLRLLSPLGGRVAGVTPGLVSFTVPARSGLSAIEAVFNHAADLSKGAQWQYANVYDPATGDQLEWIRQIQQ